MSLVGDEALEDQVLEEFRQMKAEERERFQNAAAGSSWLGKLVKDAFNYEGKCEFDMQLVEVRRFIA